MLVVILCRICRLLYFVGCAGYYTDKIRIDWMGEIFMLFFEAFEQLTCDNELKSLTIKLRL